MEKGMREDGDGRGSAVGYEPARAKLAASLTWLCKKLDGPGEQGYLGVVLGLVMGQVSWDTWGWFWDW